MKLNTFTQQQVLEHFNYDPMTGNLTWKIDRSIKTKAGMKVGSIAPQGVQLVFNRKTVGASNIIWCYMTGVWPEMNVGYIDKDKTNLKWDNLRLADNCQIQHSRKINCNNTSGVRGAYWVSRVQKWECSFNCRGEKIRVGWFCNLGDAEQALKSARKKYYGDFANDG